MKYNHTNRISLSCYEYAFRTWPLYEWSVKVSTTHSAVEISRKPPPSPSPDTHTPRKSKSDYQGSSHILSAFCMRKQSTNRLHGRNLLREMSMGS